MMDRMLGLAEAARREPEAVLARRSRPMGCVSIHAGLLGVARGRHAGRAPAALAGLSLVAALVRADC